MVGLDELDCTILSALEADARLAASELARRLGAPVSTIRDRMRNLEETGVILGYTTRIDPARLGLGIKAIIQVSRDQSVSLDDLWAEPLRIGEVVGVQLTTGETDALITVYARDVTHLKEIIYNKIGALPGLTHVSTAIILEERQYPLLARGVRAAQQAVAPQRPAE